MKKIFKTLIGCVITIGLILPMSSCEKSGCTNPAATNYNSAATKDDGSCKIPGCTDPTATNYNSAANVNSGTCTYPNGQVVFWYNSIGTTATVIFNGQTATITQYYASSTPTCGSSGCATFSAPPGTYPFTATSVAGTTWNGNVTVTSNGCFAELLQ